MRQPSDPRRNFGRESQTVTAGSLLCGFPLPEITDAMEPDVVPAVVRDTVAEALAPQAPLRRRIVAVLMALGLVVGWIAAIAFAHGCSAVQRQQEAVVVAQVVEIGRDAAKAVCRFAESPGAETLTTVVAGAIDPRTGAAVPLTFAGARMACSIFVDDQRTPVARIAVLADGRVAPAE